MSEREKKLFLASGDLISITRAADMSPYSAEYLSLLARKGRLKAVKISRDWLTTQEAVKDYVNRQEQKHKSRLSVLRYAQNQLGFVSLKVALAFLSIAMIATEGFLVSRFAHIDPPRFAAQAVTQTTHWASTATIARGMAAQTKQLAAGFQNDFKALYFAAANVVRPAFSNQKQQGAKFAGDFISNLKAPVLAANNVIGPALKDQQLSARNVWQGLVYNTGLLDKYARNDFDDGKSFAFLASSRPTRSASDEERRDPLTPISNIPYLVSEDKGFLDSSSKPLDSLGMTENRAQVLGETIQNIMYPISVSSAELNQLIDSRLNQYLQEGKFKGDKGDKGDAGAQGPAGAGSTLQGGYSVGYVNMGNPGGQGNGTIGSFTYFSASDINTESVDASGNATIGGTLNVSGASTFATSTISSLTVSGPVTLNGSTTIAGLTVTGLNPGLTQGSVAFQTSSGLSEDNLNLFWDNSNKRLGIGTTSPIAKLDVYGNFNVATSSTPALFVNTATGNVGIGTANPGNTLDITGSISNGDSVRVGITNTHTTGRTDTFAFNDVGKYVGFQINGSTLAGSYSGIPIANSAKFIASVDNLLIGNESSTGAVEFVTNGIERVRITNTGNVGIGTTTPAANLVIARSSVAQDNSDMLNIENYSQAAYPFAGLNTNVNNTNGGGYLNFRINGTTYGQVSYFGTGDTLKLINSRSGPITLSTNDTERIRVDASGNVGIGTTDPQTKLHIHEGSAGGGLKITNSDSGVTASDGLFFGLGVSEEAYLWQRENSFLSIGTNNSEKVRITTDGNVGIGTSNPLAKLEVSGDVHLYPTGNLIVYNGYGILGNNNSQSIQMVSSGGGGGIQLNATSGGSINLMSGNVGIGTTSPQGKLNVYSGASGATANENADDLIIEGSAQHGLSILTPNNSYGHIAFGDQNGALAGRITYDHSLDQMEFYSSAARRLVINNNGNVGIGTTGPGAKLQIYPNANSTKGLIVQGDNNASANIQEWQNSAGTLLSTFNNSGGYGTFNFYNNAGDYISSIGVTSGKSLTFSTPYNGIYSFSSGQSGQASKVELVTAEGKQAGMQHFDVANVNGRLLNIFGQPGVAISFSPAETEVMRMTTAGNVGIGTTGPLSQLQVGSLAGLDGNLGGMMLNENLYYSSGWKLKTAAPGYLIGGNGSTDGSFHVYTSPTGAAGSGTTITDRFTILNTGNVGIGTTSPGTALDVQSANGSIRLLSGNINNYASYAIGRTAQDGQIGIAAATSNFATGAAAGDMVMNALSGKLLLGTSNGVPTMALSGANVGIGTTSPSERLHVYSSASEDGIKIDATTYPEVLFNRAGVNKGAIGISGTAGGFLTGSLADSLVVSSVSGALHLGANNAMAVTISTAGNVGIGTTSPQAKLVVTGSGTGAMLVGDPGYGGNYVGMGLGSSLSLTNYALLSAGSALSINREAGNIYFREGNSDIQMTIASGGNVGIGTTTINSKFVIQGSGATSATKALSILNSGATEMVTVLNNGNVGIGTTSPAAKLQVVSTGESLRLNYDSSNFASFTTNSDGTLTLTNSAFGNVKFGGGNAEISIRGGLGTISHSGAGMGIVATGYMNIDPSGDLLLKSFATGNVGIGTTSPTQKLSIGSVSSGGNVKIANGWLCVDDNDTCTGATTAGTIYATNGTVSGGADVAENYPTLDTSLEAGDVVMADGSFPIHVKKSSPLPNPPHQGEGTGGAVIGIISTKPGVLLGHNQDFASSLFVPVALAGRVPVKVTSENGNIKPGDFLTISPTTPGYATKAVKAGYAIGQALENHSTGNGTVLVFINKTYFVPKVADMLQNGLDLGLSSDDMASLALNDSYAFNDLVVVNTLYIGKKLVVKEKIETAELVADTITAKEKLCVDDVCVNKVQLKALLEMLNGQGGSVAGAVSNQAPEQPANPPVEEVDPPAEEPQTPAPPVEEAGSPAEENTAPAPEISGGQSAPEEVVPPSAPAEALPAGETN